MAVAEKDLRKMFKSHTFHQLIQRELRKSNLSASSTEAGNYVDQLMWRMQKALATGNISGFANGTALQLQNLDSVMSSALFQEDQLIKQRFFEHVGSINANYQWTRRNQYGTTRGVTGFVEGGIGPVGNASWARNQQPVSFFGVQRGTTVIANLAGALGGEFVDPVEEENYDGTLQLLSSVEHALSWGNANVTDAGGNIIMYNGFYQGLMAQTPVGSKFPVNVIDLHGAPITFDVISQISVLAAKQYVATARDMAGFLTPDSMQTLQLLKSQAERRDLSNGEDGGFTAGTPIDGYNTNIGRLALYQDVFLQPFDGGTQPLTTADSGSPAPFALANTPSAAAAAPTGSQVSNWLTNDANTVYYTVSAFNAQGESLGYTLAAGTVVAAGQVVTVTIPNVAGAYGYRVYRGLLSSGADANWIGDCPRTSTTNATFVDDNRIMPGMDVAIFANKAPSNLAIAQMAPLIKLPLAIQNTTIPFGLLYLHTLAIKIPERQFMVINIGKTNYAA